MANYYILHQFSEANREQALLDVQQLSLARYDNPFERKSFLEHKEDMASSAALNYMRHELCSPEMIRLVQRLTNLPIEYSAWKHYGGLFVYSAGDYLQSHVDAGIHPSTSERKVATACLYLTDASLLFWSGDNCLEHDPQVWLPKEVTVRAGECILFTNHDLAWHSVPIQQVGQRVCLTVSYMASPSFKHSSYQNPRTRAYFARRYGQADTPELAELRLKRASEEYHQEVYRWTGNTK